MKIKLPWLFLWIIGYSAGLNLIFSSEVWAKACPGGAVLACGTPEIYNITFKKFEVSQDSGTTWKTVKDATQTLDIVSAGSDGSLAGAFIPNGTMFDAGHYDRIRVTVSNTFSIKGKITYNPGGGNQCYYTTAAGTSSVAGACGAGDPAADYAEQSITPPGLTTDISAEMPESFDVVPGATMTESVYADVVNTIELYQTGFAAYTIYPGEPAIDDSDD